LLYLVGDILSADVMPGCRLLMFPRESPRKWKLPEVVAGPWPLPWDSGVKGQMVPSTMEYPQEHVAESCRVGSPCLWAVFVGCGESNKQIFL